MDNFPRKFATLAFIWIFISLATTSTQIISKGFDFSEENFSGNGTDEKQGQNSSLTQLTPNSSQPQLQQYQYQYQLNTQPKDGRQSSLVIFIVPAILVTLLVCSALVIFVIRAKIIELLSRKNSRHAESSDAAYFQRMKNDPWHGADRGCQKCCGLKVGDGSEQFSEQEESPPIHDILMEGKTEGSINRAIPVPVSTCKTVQPILSSSSKNNKATKKGGGRPNFMKVRFNTADSPYEILDES